MKITSPEFKHNEMIPSGFTCDGDDVNPTFDLEEFPKAAKSLAMIVDDPDAPGKTWVHWVVFDIPLTGKIAENSILGKQGMNDFKKKNYGGPCPPPGSGVHRYFFKMYALDRQLDLREGISKHDLERAMQGHILAQAELIGLYTKD